MILTKPAKLKKEQDALSNTLMYVIMYVLLTESEVKMAKFFHVFLRLHVD